MKKFIKATMVGMAGFMGLTMAACGTPIDPAEDGGIDPTKTQIYVDVYNGGTGVAWIEELAKEWNATNAEFEVKIVGKEKFNIETCIAQMQSGLSDTSSTVYYTVTPSYGYSIIDNDYLVDLSDVVSRDVDGNGKTIKDKLGISQDFKDGWHRISSKSDGTGIYALPYADSYSGFVYDHGTFLQYGWLNYADTSVQSAAANDGIRTSVSGKYLVVENDSDYYNVGDKLLTAGKDGKYGTYDDGQPITYEEWQTMIEKIVTVSGKRAFLWTGQHAEYVDPIFYGAMSQMGGLEEGWAAVMNRDSNGNEILLNNGQSVAIDYSNGYLADQAQVLTDALKFMEEIVCTEEYVNSKSYSGQTTHTDAQNAFLLGYLNERSNPETAMLIEGTWWENEARSFFISLENDGEEGRGYGQRDYRYMLLPDFEGQKSTKSHFSTVDCGAVAIAKLPDTEANNKKTEASKDFLAYTLKDENLRRFTVRTGINRAYDYELTAEDRAKMTPFARAVFDIYHDTENIEIVHPSFITSPFYKSSGFYGVEWINSERNLAYGNIAACIKAGGAQSMINRWNNRCTAERWAEIVQEATDLGLIK